MCESKFLSLILVSLIKYLLLVSALIRVIVSGIKRVGLLVGFSFLNRNQESVRVLTHLESDIVIF